MNRYDEYYNFRLAKIGDVDRIMSFIRKEWNENHILAHDKNLFLWQYGRTEYDDYESINFVIMEDKSGNMVGGIGYVAYSNDSDKMHISTAITKTKAEGMLPMSGLELMKRQMELVGEKVSFSSGSNPNTIKPLFKNVFHHEVGVMQQFYMLNDSVTDYRIAVIKDKTCFVPCESEFVLHAVENIEEVTFDFTKEYDRMSYKSREFINKRYFKHPVYQYKKWMLVNKNGKCEGLLFGREISINDSRILRIVDYRGKLENLYNLGSQIKMLIMDGGYEYVDLMVAGLDDMEMRKCGFGLLDPDGENIFPNYFEPFEQRNIKVHYQKSADIVIFKADGDQDRPNKR